MKNFTRIIITMLGYLLSLGFIIIGIIGLKKVEKEFKQLNYVSDMERKKRFQCLICILIGCFIPVIISIILILVLLNIV